MAEYIEREAAIEQIRLIYCKDCNSYNGVRCRACEFDDAMSLIEDCPTADVAPKSEVDKLRQRAFEQGKRDNVYGLTAEELAQKAECLSIELEAMRTAANAYKMHYEKAKSEVERLHGILLQFTDIVHKWGAKNNIDTSEISLVPILQEEADSIIKKANQGVAREIIDDFDEELHKFAERYHEQGKIEYFTLCEVIYQLVIAKIKKKYTEGE